MTSSELVAQYLEIEKNATPGPWRATRCSCRDDCEACSVEVYRETDLGTERVVGIAHTDYGYSEPQNGNAAFISWCRNNVPTLVAHLKDALAEVERLRHV